VLSVCIRLCFLAFSLTLILFSSLSADFSRILTERTQRAVENSPTDIHHKLWLYLSEDAVDSLPAMLTGKARARRARADPTTLLVDAHDYPISQDALRQIRNTGVHVRRVSKWLRAVSVEADSEQLERLKSLSFIKRIDLVKILITPSFPEVRQLQPKDFPTETTARLWRTYGLTEFQNLFINAVKLHQAGLSGKGVTIALFDTGFEINHRAFDSAHIVATYDFINNDTTVDEVECPEDITKNHQNYHGTLIFGVIGGNVTDTLIGVAPGSDFVLAKTEITCDTTEIKIEEDNWIAAAEWADSIGVDIISSSVGYTEFTDSGSYTFEDLDGNTALITIAADVAASKNILIVNAAGNQRNKAWGHIVTPADGDSVLAIGAVCADSTLAPFSSPGPTADGRIKPDVVTLGVDVFTAIPSGGYAVVSGTSLSTPLVAGGAALALEHDSTLTAAELRHLITQSGDRSAQPDNDFGWGLYDATRSADIIKIDRTAPIRVLVNEFLSVPITTSGRSDVVPLLSAFDLPSSTIFIDHDDGTGHLELFGSQQNPAVVRFGMIADVGYFADTTYLLLETYPCRPFVAAPNPFADSIRIYVAPRGGRLISISIFNAAGEKVWEKVNSSELSADVINTWNGRNREGRVVAAGVYLVHVKTDQCIEMLKVLKTD
jgi:serine protease AprX